jgi:hypothetical protein
MIIPGGDRDYWKLDHESNETDENFATQGDAGGAGAAPLRAGCQADRPAPRDSHLHMAWRQSCGGKTVRLVRRLILSRKTRKRWGERPREPFRLQCSVFDVEC